jgi:hypothetical protein
MTPEHNLNPQDDVLVDPEACWKLLERVAASSHLNRAPRLREFLFYVGNKSLKDGINEVHEQEIGSVVFGRQPHYDTSQDNIVRVNATELRKRIDAYFISEGVNEPLSFQIPRGGYKPVFRRQKAAPAPLQTPDAPAEVATITEPAAQAASRTGVQRLSLLLPLIGVLALALACLLLWRQNRALRMELHPWQTHPATAAFWSGFLGANQDTDIVLADTSFALVQSITGKTYPLPDYLNGTYLNEVESLGISADHKADLSLISSRLNGSIGDFGVAQKIRSLDPASTHLFVKFAREYNADSLKRDNTILIGGRQSNPWVDLFSDQLNFHIESNSELNHAVIKNMKPRAGEQQEYVVPIDPFGSNGYSVIALLPNPSHTARTLLIEGTDSQATNAAGEFITSEASMEDFRKRLPGGQFSSFEILLKTTRLNSTPLKAEIITYRVY